MGSPVPRPPGPMGLIEGLGLMEGTDFLKGCWFFSPGPLLPWNNAAPRLPWLQEGRFCVKSTHLKKYIYLWLHWVFVAVLRLSLFAESRGYSPAVVHRLLTAVASLVEHRLSGCGTQV